MTLAQGDCLGRYRIAAPIGAGGMGEVYRARDERLGRMVAVKVLPTEVAGDPDRLARFEREARALARLSHHNILAIHDFGSQAGVTYAVTELLEGETLRNRIAGGALPWRTAVEVAAAIADGLTAAHEAGVVHRDLKPENVFLTADGRVKVLDFGLAKLAEPLLTEQDTVTSPPPGTIAGSMLGTIGYMSPEQVRGEPADHRSDIFALGCVLHETLTARPPFRRGSEAETLSAILNEEPPELSITGTDVTLALGRVVARCLAKDPSQRFQSGRDLAFSLRSLSSEPARMSDASDDILGRAHQPSIAVLPFRDMSPQRDQDFFCEGMSEEIINALARIDGLRVIARTSAFAFKDRFDDVREIGRQLDVDTLLEGSVRTSGSRLRITAQLVRVEDGSHLWSGRFDREIEDVFAVQDEISAQIVDNLNLRFAAQERGERARGKTPSVDSYNLYLKGRHFWSRFEEDGFLKAMDCFQQAIDKAPDYARAHAGLALCHASLGIFFHLPPRGEYDKAEAAARTALTIDDNLAEAHLSLALVKISRGWDWTGAEAEFRRAIELNPTESMGHYWYGSILSVWGRHSEAIAEAEKALELDPLSPVVGGPFLGLRYYYAGQFEQAIEQFRRTLEIDPNFEAGHAMMAFPCAAAGRINEAIASAERSVELLRKRNPVRVACLGFMCSLSPARRDDATRALEELIELAGRQPVSPFWIATIFAGLGRRDEAFEWLNRACDECDLMLMFLGPDPILRRLLQEDPRYHRLLKRIRLRPAGDRRQADDRAMGADR